MANFFCTEYHIGYVCPHRRPIFLLTFLILLRVTSAALLLHVDLHHKCKKLMNSPWPLYPSAQRCFFSSQACRKCETNLVFFHLQLLVEDITCLCTKQTRKNLTTSTTNTRQAVDARTGKNRFVRVCGWVGGCGGGNQVIWGIKKALFDYK